MTAVRILFVLTLLGVPAVFALLVRAGGHISKWSRGFCAAMICVIPLAAPWLVIGVVSPLSVGLIAIGGGIVMLKAIDWLARPRQEHDLIRVLVALTFWPSLQIEDALVPLPRSEGWLLLVARRITAGLAGLMSGLALSALGQYMGIPYQGVLLDSAWKTLEIYLLAGGCNHLMVGSFALAGFQVRDGFRYPILARSILDFWSRYDVWIHRWLKQHIFVPIGRRRRRPFQGILAVFGTSGLLHEYLFLPVDRTVLGWQLGFFLVHGLGAVAAVELGLAYTYITRRRVPRALAMLLTLAFLFLTAPLFIHCLDRVADLHSGLGACVLRLVETALAIRNRRSG